MELPKVTELKKIIKFCRENGISSLKHGDFEVVISPAAHFPKEETEAVNEEVKSVGELTDEQILYYSVTGFPPDQGKEAN